jgi:hypothetical protein
LLASSLRWSHQVPERAEVPVAAFTLRLVRSGSAAVSRRRPRGGRGFRRWRVPGWQVRAAGGVPGSDSGCGGRLFLLHHIAGRGQVGDDAAGAALGDAHAGRDAAQPHGPGRAMHSSTRAWLVRKLQLATSRMLPNSRNLLLVFGCECSLRDTHRNSAAEGGQLPGATGGAHAHRHGHHHGCAHGARNAASG